jgi:UV excision repair protein RAD23
MPSAGAGQTAPTAAEPASSFNDPSALLVGQQGNSVVSQMEAMGFERSQIDRAMRAAFFNPDRAIEYLLSGIPESVQAEQRQGGGARGVAAATSPPPTTTTAAAPTSPPAAETRADEAVNLFEVAAQAGQGQGGARGGAAARSGTGAAAGGAPAGAVNMDFLRNSPHFQHLRQLVQQQPAMLEPILQQVAEGNPQLAQMIGQNQDQFLQLLSEVRSMRDDQKNPLLKIFYRISVVMPLVEWETLDLYRPVRSLLASQKRSVMPSSGYVGLASHVMQWFRPTLPVTRTKS